jgi:hypothetical protein
MSPEEMTVDPSFVINPSMDEVERSRHADMYYECGEGTLILDAPRRLVLSDGREILVPSIQWMSDNNTSYLDYIDDIASPAALEIQRMSADAPPEAIVDNADEASSNLYDYNLRVAEMFDLDLDDADSVGPGPIASGCGCSQGTPAGFAGLLPLLTLLGRRTRRDPANRA